VQHYDGPCGSEMKQKNSKDLWKQGLMLVRPVWKQERAGRLQTALNRFETRKHELVRLKADEVKEDKENACKESRRMSKESIQWATDSHGLGNNAMEKPGSCWL